MGSGGEVGWAGAAAAAAVAALLSPPLLSLSKSVVAAGLPAVGVRVVLVVLILA